MPTYDYECTECEHSFEMFQQITEDSITTCPSCGEDKVRRLIGAGAAILFKGSGFYQTDYRSKDYKSKKEADTKSETKSDSKGTKKAEKKVEKKKE